MLTEQLLPSSLRLFDMHSHDARHILAARSWCVLGHAAQDPLPRLEAYLQSDIVAKRFGLLMEVVTAIWPEPFAIYRLCCASVSLDEGLLARAIELAAANARPQFDELLREMLSEDARNMLLFRARFLYPRATSAG
jgi:hypothetical protein